VTAQVVRCGRCGASHRAAAEVPVCPACRGPVSAAEPPLDAPAERRRPRTVTAGDAAAALQRSVGGRWFPCDDAAMDKLAARLAPVWWSWWLVDVDARGVWQAEVGFDYEVASTVEVYGSGGWTTKQQTERRTRWEPRAGRVARRYPDVVVAALADTPFFVATSTTAGTEPCPESTARGADGAVHLPDRPTAEQWPTALERVRYAVGEDCARAAGADRVRETYLDLEPDQAAWTLLLAPGWVTHYVDDDGRPHVLRVDGVTGAVEGEWVTSPARRRFWAWVHGGAAAALLATALACGGVGLVLWFLLPVAAVLGVVGVAELAVAGWCLLRPAD
jgi:hypothetical protein